MLKLSDNPPMLWPDVASLTALEGSWWVAHTKSRFEKTFAHDLRGRGVGYYLPLSERVRVSGGRRRRVLAPVFPSYVFFCGSPEDRYTALATGRLCRVIDIVEQERFVRELSAIEQALAGSARLDPYPFAAVGGRCRVTQGPLEGLEGVVVQRTGTARLVLEVAILGQGAAVEIDADLLEPAE